MARRKKKKSGLFNIIAAAVAIAVIVRGFVLMADVFSCKQEESVVITIESDEPSSYEVGKILERENVIKSPVVFWIISTLKGTNDSFFKGEFALDEPGLSYPNIINRLTYRSNYKTKDITVTEGMTVKEIEKLVCDSGFVSEDEFSDALSDDYDYSFLPEKETKNRLEGYLFPDTYNISNTMTAHEIIDLMLSRFSGIYTDEFSKRAKQMGYTNREIIIMASVIEGEAAEGSDRAKVASVFYNRLESKEFSRLQSCATVQYILGERKKILSNEDIKIDSPYNTYKYPGLPYGPICNPGVASIKAALYPEDTDYYYFQSDADGKLYFSETFTEHEDIRENIQ